MRIILETSRKEEEHKWHATDRRYPLLYLPPRIPADEYNQMVEAVIRQAGRNAARERRERRADNT